MSAAESRLHVFEPLRLRYLDSPLPRWRRLASEALLALLPATMRAQLSTRHRRLLLSLDADGLQLRTLAGERSSLIGMVPVDDPELLVQLRVLLDSQAGNIPRWLLLESRQVLRPAVTVPASAEPRLREMMIHEIDRQTPFAPDQVSFEPRVLSRDALTRNMRVELVVMPRVLLDEQLARLGPMATGLAGVDVAEGDGACLGVNLLPLAGRAAGHDRARILNWLLALAALMAVFASMWLALGNRRQAQADFSVRLASASADARDVRKLRNALEGSLQAANFLASQRAQQPTMLELLADLTGRIPDNTSIEKMSVNGGAVIMIGQSQQASSLVGLLQASPLIKTPTLTGSVQTDPRTGKERFTLTAVVAGSATEKESADAAARAP